MSPFGFVHTAHLGADVAGHFGDACVLLVYAEIVGGGSQSAAAASAAPKVSTPIVQALRSRPTSSGISRNVEEAPSLPGSALPALVGRYRVAQASEPCLHVSIVKEAEVRLRRDALSALPPAAPTSQEKRVRRQRRRKSVPLPVGTPVPM